MCNSAILERARSYEKCNVPKTVGEKPVFHFSVPTGWMNDPNGFSYFCGTYHLFFQYNPYSTEWGPMHWGHCTTKDFVHWEILPCAMAPDAFFDNEGCFSGTAVESGGKHVLLYTGVQGKTDGNGKPYTVQNQCVAFGDGVNYEKYKGNPVISSSMLPEGSSVIDFRDPKIWKEGDGFRALVGSKAQDGSGQLALFSSRNAIEWKFEKIIDRCKNEYGRMWECPDFFALDGRQILIVSPQFMEADGEEFHAGNNTIYFVGDWDEKEAVWKRDKPHLLDAGLDFYAAQTVLAADGRRIMIGWLQNWDNHILPDGQTWSGIMTVPRELKVAGGRLLQTPVRELEACRQNRISYFCVPVGGKTKKTLLNGVAGRIFDMTLTVKNTRCGTFAVYVAADETHFTKIVFDMEKNTLGVDRSRSGLRKDFITDRTFRLPEVRESLQLRVLFDKYALEVFANDGETALSLLVYTPLEADRIYFTADTETAMDVEKSDIAV